MKKKIYLPKNLTELKNLNHKKQSELWKRYCLGNYQRQLRALWYYIACENFNLRIERKHITKLEKYSRNPDECMFRAYKNKYILKPGTEITKIFKGRKYKIAVIGVNDFVYENHHYKTLSAIAKNICGIKVSGYDFFGLNNKNTLKGKTNG